MQASDVLLQLRDTSAATSRAPVPSSVLLEPALAPPSSHSDWGHLLVPDYSQLSGTSLGKSQVTVESWGWFCLSTYPRESSL